MKPFIPNKLIQIVEKIEQQHPLVAAELPSIPSQSLYELIQRINQADEDELEASSYTLTKREIQALCRYLEHDEYHANLQKIITVIKVRFDKMCFSILFRIWHNAPNQLFILNVLAEYDKPNYRTEDIKIKPGILDNWANSRLPLLAVVRTCQDISNKAVFEEKYETVGLVKNTALYYQSYVKFLQKTTLEQFIVEGDLHIAEILEHVERANSEHILLELLRCATPNKNKLLEFKAVYKHAYKLWGEPSRKTFPSNRESEYQIYKYWYDATQLSLILGHDPRRERFWARFLGLETVHWSVVSKHNMLVIAFGKNIVTEFMEMGPVYIYEKEYYDRYVVPRLPKTNTSSLKSWMVNESTYLSREVHLSNWESKQLAALRKYGLMR